MVDTYFWVVYLVDSNINDDDDDDHHHLITIIIIIIIIIIMCVCISTAKLSYTIFTLKGLQISGFAKTGWPKKIITL